MKYFWLSLFGFLAFVFLMLGIFQPDMLIGGLTVLGRVVITLAYMLVAGDGAVLFIGGGACMASKFLVGAVAGCSVPDSRSRSGRY